MNGDLLELLNCLKSHQVEFLVVGAHAVGFHSRPRMTHDLALWVGRSPSNSKRLRDALEEFGAPIGNEGAKRFSELDRQMVRIGVPPNTVDIINFGGKTTFDEVYSRRVPGRLEEVDLYFPSLNDLISIKRSAGRPQDLADIESLERYHLA
jgi:hypothetical protein